jgi:hypothetical protein
VFRKGTRAHALRRARTCYNNLAGSLGTVLTNRLVELDWIRHVPAHRAVLITDAGRRGLHDTFGVPDD